MSTYVFFPFHSIPFLSFPVHNPSPKSRYRQNHICPLGGGALPDINEAVGVPYDPSAGLKP
jgi:hypothetical protein